jgi:hypothetical protein
MTLPRRLSRGVGAQVPQVIWAPGMAPRRHYQNRCSHHLGHPLHGRHRPCPFQRRVHRQPPPPTRGLEQPRVCFAVPVREGQTHRKRQQMPSKL